jgi:hypothetical protein
VAEGLTPEQARERAAAVLAGAVACVPVQELAGRDWPAALAGRAVLVAEETPMPQAIALYRDCKRKRGQSGLAPLLVTRDGFDQLRLHEWLAPGGEGGLTAAFATYDALTAERFFTERAAAAGADPAAAIEGALDDLGHAAHCDPMSILHRLRIDDLEAIASGDAEIDPAELLPDDVTAAHAQMLAEREAFLELARRTRGPQLVMTQNVRSFDEETALAEIGGGPARLLLCSTSPAVALLVLGFGGFNDCPPPAAQARVWGTWASTVSAEPVLLDGATLHGVVARPPATRATLVRFAAEAALYDRDALMNGALALAGSLYRNAGVEFWWD